MLPSLVADMDIAVTVIRFLRERGVDVVSAREEGWSGYEDRDILREAHEMNRFVLTHDSDYGELVIHQGATTRGIIYMRAGSSESKAVIAGLQNLLNEEIDWTRRQIVVCEPDKPLRIRFIDN